MSWVSDHRDRKITSIRTTGDGANIREALDRLGVSYIMGPDGPDGVVFSVAYDRAEEVRLWAELKELLAP